MIKFAFPLLLLASIYTHESHAQQAPIEGTMEQFIVKTDHAGREVFDQANDVWPGDVVEYRLVYRNVDATNIRDLRIRGPIPESTSYHQGSASAQGLTQFRVSVDAGQTFEPEPVIRKRRLNTGEIVETVLGPEHYTDIQWIKLTPLEPGRTTEFRYRVQID